MQIRISGGRESYEDSSEGEAMTQLEEGRITNLQHEIELLQKELELLNKVRCELIKRGNNLESQVMGLQKLEADKFNQEYMDAFERGLRAGNKQSTEQQIAIHKALNERDTLAKVLRNVLQRVGCSHDPQEFNCFWCEVSTTLKEATKDLRLS